MNNIKGNLIRASNKFVVGCSVRMHTIICSPLAARTGAAAERNTNTTRSSNRRRINLERTANAIKELQHSYYNRVLTMAGTSTSYSGDSTTAERTSSITIHHMPQRHDETTTPTTEYRDQVEEQEQAPPSPPSSPPRKFSCYSPGKYSCATSSGLQYEPSSPKSTILLSTPPPPPRPKFERKDFILELLSPDTVRHLEMPTLDTRDDVETRMNPFYLEPRASSSFCFY
mmetsp:Transcript_16614/g.31476  ORF Transcript_16614/g.31476 Transcript_16614/m.31476 type:complete len:228 (-) Transcript_16614:239-922(-)